MSELTYLITDTKLSYTGAMRAVSLSSGRFGLRRTGWPEGKFVYMLDKYSESIVYYHGVTSLFIVGIIDAISFDWELVRIEKVLEE